MFFLHIILFLFTIGSTIYVGSGLFGFDGGLLYGFAIMAILLAHEMGHYLMSRRYGIPSTLPYFIPFPMEPFGTFGAIIKIKGMIYNKRTLFDVGVAGPLSGFIVAVPFIIAGILLSKVQVVAGGLHFDELGKSLFFIILKKIFIGEIPRGLHLMPHPFVYAGWVGLFVTALNLLPVGQLDGGHVVYAVFGDKSRLVSRVCIVLLALLAVFYNPGWLTLVILLLIFGRKHPQPYDTKTPLDNKRKVIACIVLVIFVLSFIPAPFPEMNTANLLDMIRKGGFFK